jgi:hypothetical protein
MDENGRLQERLDAALAEIRRLRDENAALRKAITLANKPVHRVVTKEHIDSAKVRAALSNDQKVALFRSLFRGREDVYAVRWVSSSGATGYSPAHSHKTDGKACRRSRKECEKLGERLYFPLTSGVIYGHLAGRYVVGIYPLLQDDCCYFLAVDFDKEAWREDVAAFLDVCRKVGIPPYPERSASGSGAHMWIFFEEPVPAWKARRLATLLLSAASRNRFQIGLDSFDRMFPNQDLMPKGGFGNLIALPLQKKARDSNNSVFLDESLKPAQDQWEYLRNIRKVSRTDLEAFLDGFAQEEIGRFEPDDRSPEADLALWRGTGTGSVPTLPYTEGPPGRIRCPHGARSGRWASAGECAAPIAGYPEATRFRDPDWRS